jgi:FO synthase
VTPSELVERIRKAVDAEPLDRASAVEIAERIERDPAERQGRGERSSGLLEPLLEAGRELGRRGHGDQVTFSRNVFIPLTNLCRNRCAYCTFAKGQHSEEAHSYALDEVRDAVEQGVRAGCKEALFCLGDKPEIAYRSYRAWLHAAGYATTADYLVDACRVAFRAQSFPHTNAGIMTREQLARLRPWNASMGLMLETTSARLRERGQAHYYAPDKDPDKRIRMTAEAGALRIPFTSGILIGIGETPEERVDTILEIDRLQRDWGHIQEVIVQNFHPKPGTPMATWPVPSDEVMAATVALTRLLLGPDMNVQAPPNLSPTALELLIRSGINDWGGVSPVTIDFINPEAPWPELDTLRRRSERAGLRLRERLCVYPELITGRPELFDPNMLRALRAACDDEGYPRQSPT